MSAAWNSRLRIFRNTSWALLKFDAELYQLRMKSNCLVDYKLFIFVMLNLIGGATNTIGS